jgi:Mg2+/Co2+ transporter CorB
MSAFFSLSETAMMASNRFRLRHLAQSGHHGAQKPCAAGAYRQDAGRHPARQQSRQFGCRHAGQCHRHRAVREDKWVLGVGTLAVTFAILVFSEITPKSSAPPMRTGLPWSLATSSPLLLLLSGCLVHQPVCQRFPQSTAPIPETGGRSQQAVPEELRSLVLESSHLIPQKHHAILSSLFELNTITVEDVMTPRGNIEILDLEQPWEDVKNQLATSHHSRLPTCRESLDQLVGILPVRRLLASLGDPGFDLASLLEQLQPPYYIPARTPVFSQLAFFQENRQRIGFVVDEYGDILGLLTMEDIIEEFVGDFTTSLPGLGQELHWSDEGEAIVEGSRPCVTSTACSASTFRWTAPKPSTV